jgi:hypothetical protein
VIVAALLFPARSFIIKLAPEKVRPVGAGGPFEFLVVIVYAAGVGTPPPTGVLAIQVDISASL